MSHRLILEGQLRRPRFHLDLSLDLDLSEPMGIFGATGAGKTTLLRIIAGLEPAFRGHVRFGDETWSDIHHTDCVPTHQRGLGVVFQDSRLLPERSVEANLAFARRRARPTQSSLTEATIVAELELGHLLGQAVESLSGGERQRVALARALLIRPRLLLLDEPVSANDSAHRDHIIDRLAEWIPFEAIPLMYVSHAAHELRQLTRQLLVLDQGVVSAQDDTESLLATPAISRSSARFAQAEVITSDSEQGTVTLHWHEKHHNTLGSLRPGDTVSLLRSDDDASVFDAALQPEPGENQDEAEQGVRADGLAGNDPDKK